MSKIRDEAKAIIKASQATIDADFGVDDICNDVQKQAGRFLLIEKAYRYKMAGCKLQQIIFKAGGIWNARACLWNANCCHDKAAYLYRKAEEL